MPIESRFIKKCSVYYLLISTVRFCINIANRLKTATGSTGETVDYTQENKHNGFGQRVTDTDKLKNIVTFCRKMPLLI